MQKLQKIMSFVSWKKGKKLVEINKLSNTHVLKENKNVPGQEEG